MEMREAISELLGAMLDQNQVTADDVISLILTATPDLVSDFPAAGARHFGFADVPLLCAQEINVQGALPRVIRVLMHIDSTRDRDEINHVYLRGAEVLRQDLHP